jgi:hypothetical protein
LLIELQPGERYAGMILGKDGDPSYHLVLLPGQQDDITWEKAMEWAAKQGGEYVSNLPTRREQSLLFANLKEEFEDRYPESNLLKEARIYANNSSENIKKIKDEQAKTTTQL